MDSREPPQYSSAPTMMAVGPTSYASPNAIVSPNSPAVVMAPATARFPFGSAAPPPPANPSEPFNGGASSAMKPCSAEGGLAKKKRGRPRKYSPDGNIALGLAPTHASPSSTAVSGGGDSGGTPSAEAPAKKHRGRPSGSGKRQLDALGTCFSFWF